MEVANASLTLPLRKFGKFSAPDPERSLLEIRLASFERFIDEGIAESLIEMGEIEIRSGALGHVNISLHSPKLGVPDRSPDEAIVSGLSFEASLTVTARSVSNIGEVVEQELLLCRLPLMDSTGGFIINGVRRVVINQIVRAPGVWFNFDYDQMTGLRFGKGRISPDRGPWIGFETNDRDELRARLNGGSSLSALAVLRLYGIDDDTLYQMCQDDAASSRKYMLNTLLLDDCNSREDALLQIYDEVSPGAPPNLNTAEERVTRMLFNRQYYSLSAVGRYMLNRRFGGDELSLLLTPQDLINTIKHVMRLSDGEADADDIDHLANRRVRTAGELVQREFASALVDMRRTTTEWSELADHIPTQPKQILRTTALIKKLSAFFSGSQLCQVTDEMNPIAELTHKRRVSSLGPGGLNRRNAGVDPRDVHPTHYGKICPTETPEGQNIGLLGTLATGANTDSRGMLTGPARPVLQEVSSHDVNAVGRELTSAVELGGRACSVRRGRNHGGACQETRSRTRDKAKRKAFRIE